MQCGHKHSVPLAVNLGDWNTFKLSWKCERMVEVHSMSQT